MGARAHLGALHPHQQSLVGWGRGAQLLPPFYEFMGRWMPTGATVRALRDLTYFPDFPHAEPYLVLGGWLVAATGAFVIARSIKYGPGRIPAPAPDPKPEPVAAASAAPAS